MGDYFETFDPPFFMNRRYAFDTLAINSKGYDRDDAEILADLSKSLNRNCIDHTGKLSISCEHQVITLEGLVPNISLARFIGKVADNVLGTRGVVNHLEVQRSGAVTQSPDQTSVTAIEKPSRQSEVEHPGSFRQLDTER